MSNISIPSMQDLLSAGVHFGHRVSRGHPKMAPFIFGARGGIHIIDLAKSEEKLSEATQEVFNLGKQGKTMLIVGTKKQAQRLVEELANKAQTYYLNKRWVGGLFTNFEEIRKNVKKLNDLKSAQTKGELSRYTKKEQLLISKKLSKFDAEMGGIANMEKIPDALFIIDAASDITAIKEAGKMGVLIIGLSDTNTDPNWFDFPIPANDDGIKSIKIICETIISSYTKGRKEAGLLEQPSAVSSQPSSPAVRDGVDNLDGAVAEQAAALEEEIEKVVIEESDRKV